MSFIGKLAYLVFFPGLAFMLLAGTASRALISGVFATLEGRRSEGPGLIGSFLMFAEPHASASGSTALIEWAAPAVKLFALSWVCCAAFGFLPDDLPLVFCLLLLAASCDLVLVSFSGSGSSSADARRLGLNMLAYAAPLALVFASVTLRTGEVRLSSVVAWQASHGVLPLASGSGVMRASSVIGLLAMLPVALAMAGLRPLGQDLFDDKGLLAGLSGPPLAEARLAHIALTFVAPLLVVALFLGGPDTRWYYLVFWALKIAALVLLFAIADGITRRLPSRAALAWMAAPSALALVSLALAWAGVTP